MMSNRSARPSLQNIISRAERGYHGSATVRGSHDHQEDRFVVDVSVGSDSTLFCVFDGHRGFEASEFCRDNFPGVLTSELDAVPANASDDEVDAALVRAVERTDALFIESGDSLAGSTLCGVLFTPQRTVAINVGDSRAVLVKRRDPSAAEEDEEFYNLTEDHSPDRYDELTRIQNLGGDVRFHGTWRVQGMLAMSRAVGDRGLKPYVVSTPELASFVPDPAEDVCVVLGSDGLFEHLDEHDIVHVLREHVGKPQEAVDELLRKTESFTDRTRDNTTAIVVDLALMNKDKN